MYQMSPDTKIPKEGDYRGLFHSLYNNYICNQYYGQGYVRNKEIDSPRSIDFVRNFEKIVKNNDYSLVIWDNNRPAKSGATKQFYQMFLKYNIKVVASPHGNKEIRDQKLSRRIGHVYDYSFVFGEKERIKLSKVRRKALFSIDEMYKRLLPAGVPSNDVLKNYKKSGKYILIIPNSVNKNPKTFTKEVFFQLKILKLSDKYGLPIVIKDKQRAYHTDHRLKDAVSKYDNVKFLHYCEDDNQIMADAKIVIGSPSTFMFKPIQLGIPSVVLRGQGEMGNFYDYPGMISPSYVNILKSIKMQMSHGRFDDYIKRTLSGGLNFNSTELYVNYIKDMC